MRYKNLFNTELKIYPAKVHHIDGKLIKFLKSIDRLKKE
jgi:hypothetical protein